MSFISLRIISVAAMFCLLAACGGGGGGGSSPNVGTDLPGVPSPPDTFILSGSSTEFATSLEDGASSFGSTDIWSRNCDPLPGTESAESRLRQRRCAVGGMNRLYNGDYNERIAGLQDASSRLMLFYRSGFVTFSPNLHEHYINVVEGFYFLEPPESAGDFQEALPRNTHVINMIDYISVAGSYFTNLLDPASLRDHNNVVVMPTGWRGSDIGPNFFAGDPRLTVSVEDVTAMVDTGLILFVGGYDTFRAIAGFGFALHTDSSRCGSSEGVESENIKVHCVLTTHITGSDVPLDNVPATDTGFTGEAGLASSIVAASLANARLLWPDMTSRQTVRLAQFCARPINPDGSLQPWGTILDEDEASDDWGQGVFSVECFFDTRGALINRITNAPLSGGLVLQGTTSELRLTDQFGRDSLFSAKRGATFVPTLPDHISGFFATPEGVLGYMWNEHVALALSHEENGFFGSYGTGDFAFGDTYTIIVRLGHQWSQQWSAHESTYFGLHAQSVYGQMDSASSSLVGKAEGHTHQFTAMVGYQSNIVKASLSVTHALGIMGDIDIVGFDNLSLAPQASTAAKFKLTTSF